MEKRFSIEELTCLHLLQCHYADICSKEERELRETIALHPAIFTKAKMIVEKQKETGVYVIPYYADDYPVSFAKISVLRRKISLNFLHMPLQIGILLLGIIE